MKLTLMLLVANKPARLSISILEISFNSHCYLLFKNQFNIQQHSPIFNIEAARIKLYAFYER